MLMWIFNFMSLPSGADVAKCGNGMALARASPRIIRRVTVICESQRNYDTLTKALLSHADKRNPLIRLTTKLSRDNFNSRKCQAGTMRSLVDHEIAVLR